MMLRSGDPMGTVLGPAFGNPINAAHWREKINFPAERIARRFGNSPFTSTADAKTSFEF